MILDTSEWNPYDRHCPSRRLLDRIGDRWTVLVVGALVDGPMRFSVIAQHVDGISEKMLTETLRRLERDGIVARTVFPVIPPHVDYQLTDSGRALCEPLAALTVWAVEHMSTVLEAQTTYDVKASQVHEPTGTNAD